MRGPLLYSNGRGEVYCASGNYGGYSLFEFMGLKGIGPAKKALRRETIMDFIPNWDESDASDKLMKFDQEMHQYLDDRNCVQVKYYPLDTLLASNYYPVTVDVLEPSGLATRAQLAKDHFRLSRINRLTTAKKAKKSRDPMEFPCDRGTFLIHFPPQPGCQKPTASRTRTQLRVSSASPAASGVTPHAAALSSGHGACSGT